MNRILILFSSLFLLSACRCRQESGTIAKPLSDTRHVKFATGFDLTYSDSGIILTVKNPWQHAEGIEYRYILSDSLKLSYGINEYSWAIRTPVRNVICLSTTHIGLISFIDQTSTITGVSGKNFIVNESVRRGIDENHVADVGYDEGLNYELILRLNPDVVFAYGVSVSVTNTVRKLNELGIPVVLIGEYLEHDPLAKMEWVKAIAVFYGMLEMASAKFDSAVSRYSDVSKIASNELNRPEVMLGLPWRGNWYVSGARSYIARLIDDAGGNYIWRDLDFNESRPLGLERIYEKALQAEIWINPGEARTREDIISVDPRFANLPPLVNNRIYNNDRRMSPYGGNDFFETGIVEPEIILSDLIAILHPHLLTSHSLKYFRKVN